MFYFWFFEVAIFTTTVSAISTEESGCIGRCPYVLRTYNNVQYLCHSDPNKYCTCFLGYPQVHECGPREHWSESENRCINLDLCVNPEDAKCENYAGHKKYCECVDDYPITQTGPQTGGFRLSMMLNIGINKSPERCNCRNIGVIPELSMRVPITPSGRSSIRPPTRRPISPVMYSPTGPCTRSPKWPPIDVSTNPTPSLPVRATEPDVTDIQGCLGQCPAFNSLTYTVHLPHVNCCKFCKCNWGRPYIFNCSPNLYYNPTLQVCDRIFKC